MTRMTAHSTTIFQIPLILMMGTREEIRPIEDLEIGIPLIETKMTTMTTTRMMPEPTTLPEDRHLDHGGRTTYTIVDSPGADVGEVHMMWMTCRTDFHVLDCHPVPALQIPKTHMVEGQD